MTTDVDDNALLPLHHMRYHRAINEEHAPQVGVHHLVPLVDRGGPNGGVIGDDAGVVTSASICPQVRMTCLATRPASSDRVTSSAKASAAPPLARISSTTWVSRCVLRPVTMVRAPSPAKARAMARPMPRPAPVINATLPVSNIRCFLPALVCSSDRGSRPAEFASPKRTAFGAKFAGLIEVSAGGRAPGSRA